MKKKLVVVCALALACGAHAEVLTGARAEIGGVPVTGKSARDGVVVSRTMLGATDAHAFADRTVIADVSDAGNYGTFDATTELQGGHVQNHLFAFQDRLKYSGSGVLQSLVGFLSRPVHSGSGQIDLRVAADIGDVHVTSGGKVAGNIGLFVRDLRSGQNNVAINLAQKTGRAIYAPGGASSYHAGPIVSDSGVVNTGSRVASRSISAAEARAARSIKAQMKAAQVGGQTSFGVDPPAVVSALQAEGLDPWSYAILYQDARGVGVRYDELLAFIISAM